MSCNLRQKRYTKCAVNQVFQNFQPRKGVTLLWENKELVENALDSAKSISELRFAHTDLLIGSSLHNLVLFLFCFCSEEIHRGKFYPKIGLGDHERRDEALYDDLRQQRLVRCVSIYLLTLRWNSDLYLMLTIWHSTNVISEIFF